ncbi:methyl-accepting chemotaxis protein [Anaerosinus massiliensis]|uniref:methyl-accepting chemotaxis protein n=1 Tax=Massilibacillus massiliensis TaxID=1806837 RepID=UPI000B0DE921|nr:methyl-accepting chemotaxis protein [Massilibacillus massiliensis]
MNFFDDLKVNLKIGCLILAAFLVVIFVGGMGYYNLQKANESIHVMYEKRLIPVREVNEVRADVALVGEAMLELTINTDHSRNQYLKKYIDEKVNNTNVVFEKLEKEQLDAKGQAIVNKIKDAKEKYRKERGPVLALVDQNKNAEAYQLYSSKVLPLSIEFSANLKEFSDYYAEISEQMKNEDKETAEQATRVTGIVIFLAFVILGASGLYITKKVVTPLNIMVTVCKELAGGDFRDKPRSIRRRDEIGQLADAMATMRDSLRALMKHVNSSSEQLAAASEELTASADQSAQASNQIAISITEVAKGAEEQLKSADHTSEAVEQISASIQQISANATEVADRAVKAEEEATKGNTAVEKSVSQMKSIEQTVISSAQVVMNLGERSREIGQIVDTISGIAGQTNLLALNAAIEAARAGEQGRGFAVVAEEVRKLAEQSQEAAKQIAELIGEIQGETEKAVVAMDEGTREVKIGAEVVNESGKAFQDIAGSVNQVSSQVKEMSQAIEHMAEGSQRIVEAVRKIDQLSKGASSEAQSVSAATEEQSASMEEIASASQSLSKLAMELQDEVGKFKI